MALDIIGLTLIKVNGIFHLDAKDVHVDVDQDVAQIKTGKGPRSAIGQIVASGSIGEVIPRNKQLDWRKLRDFKLEIFDQETQSIVVFEGEGCNWNKQSLAFNNTGPEASRSASFKCDEVIKV